MNMLTKNIHMKILNFFFNIPKSDFFLNRPINVITRYSNKFAFMICFLCSMIFLLRISLSERDCQLSRSYFYDINLSDILLRSAQLRWEGNKTLVYYCITVVLVDRFKVIYRWFIKLAFRYIFSSYRFIFIEGVNTVKLVRKYFVIVTCEYKKFEIV